MKKTLCIALAFIMCLALVACGNNPAPAASDDTASEASNWTFGLSIKNQTSEYWNTLTAGETARCEELGIKYIVHNQADDATEMVTGCENLIAQGVDALIISPAKQEALTEIVALAHEEGIPVIIVDMGGGQSDYDCFIRSDGFVGGQMAADKALKLLEAEGITSGEYGVIRAAESSIFTIYRGDGYIDAMDAAGFTCVAKSHANAVTDLAYNAMKDILIASPNVVSIFCENDLMAMGAANAIEEAGRTGDIVVIGFDNNAAAADYLKEGKMAATIAQDPSGLGAAGVDAAAALLRGETLDFTNADSKEILFEVVLILPEDIT